MQRALVLAIIVAGLFACPILNGFPESLSADSSFVAGEGSNNNPQWDSADVETSDTQLQGLHAQAFTLTELVLPPSAVFSSERFVANATRMLAAPSLGHSFERGPPSLI